MNTFWIFLINMRCKFWIIFSVLEFSLAFTVENGDVPVLQPFSLPGEVIRGQSVILTCSVASGRSPFVFRWDKGDSILPPGDTPTSSSEYSLLLLKSVDGTKSGNYTCTVSNSAGTANQTIEILVHEPPEWVVVPEDVEGISGNDIRIDCSAKGVPEPQILWRKKGSTNTHSRYHVLSNGSLFLQDIHPEDSGEYECIAKNGVGVKLQQAAVIVHVPPHFQEGVDLLKIRSSHSAVLRCDVIGDAPLRVVWTKDYMDDRRFKIQETPLPNGLLSELSIFRVTRQDAGLYTCSASNAYGQEQKTMKLIVLEPPSNPLEVHVKDVKQSEVSIQWDIPHSGNSPIIKYVLQYWRDTGGPPKLEEVSVKGGDKTEYSLIGLKAGTSYVVRLIAENEFGASSPSIPVRFSTQEDKPSGYPTDLSVSVRGLHHLTVRWKAPAPEQQNGAIRGYELGFRELGGKYYEYQATSLGPGPVQEYMLQGLKEDTEYEIVVRAHNQAGQGPHSVPLFTRTRRRGQLLAPRLQVESTTANSVSLKWSGNEDIQVLHYVLYYRPEGETWRERTIPGRFETSLMDLQENTLYQMYLQAVSGQDYSPPSDTISVKTTAVSNLARSSLMQGQASSTPQGLSHTTLVISLSVVISCVVIVCIIAAACVYVTRFTTMSHSNKIREIHSPTELREGPPTSRSTPLSRHTFRYVDVHSRPLLYCSTPAPVQHSDDYPSPYATLPLRHTPMGKLWNSDERLSSERSESIPHQRIEIPDDKVSMPGE